MNLHDITKTAITLAWAFNGNPCSDVCESNLHDHHNCDEMRERLGVTGRNRIIYCECRTCEQVYPEIAHYFGRVPSNNYICEGCTAGFHPAPPEE